jgi:hypothetical protein
MATLELGGLPVTTGQDASDRMALLLWGPATVGKTCLAATAPGGKLWLSFGDNEHVSVAGRDDVHVVNLSHLSVEELFKHAQSDNPFGLDKFLANNTGFESVVLDSATALAYRALQKSVLVDKIGAGRGFTPSMEAPGIAAYGGRNAIVLEVLTGFLRVTSKHNVHAIITAHEADPTTKTVQGAGNTQQEVIDYIGVMLGGQLVNNMTWRLSEIWFMSQDNQQRSLMVRPSRKRRPCKTRMFEQRDVPAEFELHYDPDLPDENQHTIASFYQQWLDNGKRRIPIPVPPQPSKGKKK